MGRLEGENMKKIYILLLIISSIFVYASDKPDWVAGRPDGCTTITVGKDASYDGSVMTSHTDDSHRTRTWVNIIPRKNYPRGSKVKMMKREKDDSGVMPAYKHIEVGEIPQVEETYQFINSAYPCMNEKQLAIGESTFGGRESLKSDKGLIDCQQLVRLMLERTATARDAIELADELTKKYGWNDYGECLTIADTKEVWHFEIVGPGKDNIGAVWVAQRVPDGHVSVNANASRIRKVNPEDKDYFLVSDNYKKVALDSNWWNPDDGDFEFCYAYDPNGRKSYSGRRREWRVLSMVAPSLNLHPNSENFPFSVKPDEKVTREKMIEIFKDYYEGTDYNFVKNITWVNDSGKYEISPLANPFMPYDMNKLFDINGGWGWRGERTIARWYTIYGTITQSREWMPDEIGGVVWFAWDNIATSIYIPIYCSVKYLPEPFTEPGRNGFSRKSAWWAFNRLGTLAAQRWGDMRHDVDKIWGPMQNDFFVNQEILEKELLQLYEINPEDAIMRMTEYTNQAGNEVVQEAWKLGDFLWTKYDEKF